MKTYQQKGKVIQKVNRPNINRSKNEMWSIVAMQTSLIHWAEFHINLILLKFNPKYFTKIKLYILQTNLSGMLKAKSIGYGKFTYEST